MVVTHATVLRAESAAGTDISGIGWPELVRKDVNSLTRLNLDLSDDVLERYRGEDLFDRWGQIGEYNVGIRTEIARISDCRERISFIGGCDGEVGWLLAFDWQDVEIVEAAVDSSWHFSCQQIDPHGCEHEHSILCLVTLRLEFDHVLNKDLRVSAKHWLDAVWNLEMIYGLFLMKMAQSMVSGRVSARLAREQAKINLISMC